jgi:RNA polymerase sigma-70 factor (ECF subfamily)
LEKLCGVYWFPVYAEIRRRGHSPHDAQDLTQEFFACLLRRNSFAGASQKKGRFRSYLLGALNFFLADQRDYEHAAKRGGGQVLLSLDEEDAEGRYLEEPAGTETPETLFDRRWRDTLLEQAFERLRLEFVADQKKAIFGELKIFLGMESGAGAYEEPARKLGMTTSAITVAVHRLRQRYGEIVRGIVSETLANPADIDEEIRQLFR